MGISVLCEARCGAGSVFGRGRGCRWCGDGSAGEEGVEVVACPAEVCAACEGGACVAGPARAVYEAECAGEGDADSEWNEVSDEEVGEGEKCGDAEEGEGGGWDGGCWEEGVDGGEIVDEGEYGCLCSGGGRRRGMSGGGPVTEGEDEEEGKGKKESGERG